MHVSREAILQLCEKKGVQNGAENRPKTIVKIEHFFTPKFDSFLAHFWTQGRVRPSLAWERKERGRIALVIKSLCCVFCCCCAVFSAAVLSAVVFSAAVFSAAVFPAAAVVSAVAVFSAAVLSAAVVFSAAVFSAAVVFSRHWCEPELV